MKRTPAEAYADHCVELLSAHGVAHARRMFGGHGVYLEGLMVGLVAAEQLYLKTDAASRPHFEAAGGRPFVYRRGRDAAAGVATLGYWTPPEEALDSPDAMRPWARLALEAALRAQAAKRPRARPAGSRVAARDARPAGTGPAAGATPEESAPAAGALSAAARRPRKTPPQGR